VTALAFAPDGRTLLSGGADAMVRLWELPEGLPCGALTDKHKWVVVAVAFAPDGRAVASVSHAAQGEAQGESRAVLGDLITRRVRPLGSAASLPFFSPTFSGDSARLALKAGSVWLFQVPSGEPAGEVPATTTGYAIAFSPQIAFSPRGHLLAVGYIDGSVAIWDTANETEVRRLTGHKGWVTHLAFSPNGKVLASASTRRPLPGRPAATGLPAADHTVCLWNVARGTRLGDPAEVGEDTACLAAFDDGSWLSWDGPETGTTVAGGRPHRPTVHRGEAGSSGHHRTWEVPLPDVRSAAVSRDGGLLAFGDGSGRIYTCPTAEIPWTSGSA
jgi:WD40 repeat protein